MKSLLDQLPATAAEGKREAERVRERAESNYRLGLQTRELVIPSKDSNWQDLCCCHRRPSISMVIFKSLDILTKKEKITLSVHCLMFLAFLFLAILFITGDAFAKTQTLSGHVAPEVVFGASVEFYDAMSSGGMSSAVIKIQNCHVDMMTDNISITRAELCMVFDIGASEEDLSFRKNMLGGTGTMPPPSAPLLSFFSENERLNFYVNTYFGGKLENFNNYMSGADNLFFQDWMLLMK